MDGRLKEKENRLLNTSRTRRTGVRAKFGLGALGGGFLLKTLYHLFGTILSVPKAEYKVLYPRFTISVMPLIPDMCTPIKNWAVSLCRCAMTQRWGAFTT